MTDEVNIHIVNPDSTTVVDRGSLVKMYNEYHEALFSFAYYYLKSKEDAQDILQDVFVKLWSAGNSLHGIINARAYLFSMVKHQVLNHMRDRNNELQHNYRFVQQQSFKDEDLMHYSDVSDNADKLNRAIEKLPEQQRRVIKLRFSGYSNREIAQMMNLSLDTINSHWRACQHNLRKYLASGVKILITVISLFSINNA